MMADYRNCSHHVLVKTDISSLGDLYVLASSQWGLQKTRDELRELKIEIAKSSSEVAELRALLATERSTRVASADALTRRVN
jgi:hypothetical protein